MLRVEGGETMRAVASSSGVTSQYISLLWKAYQLKGAAGIVEKSNGPRQTRDLTPGEEGKLRAQITSELVPSRLGLVIPNGKPDQWSPSLALKLAKRQLDFIPQLSQMNELFRKWNIRIPRNHAEPDLQFSEDYYEYIKSPIAKQIRERELLAAEKWEQERALAGKKSKVNAVVEVDPGPDPFEEIKKNLQRPVTPRQRVGKHSKSNSHKPKKKRRK